MRHPGSLCPPIFLAFGLLLGACDPLPGDTESASSVTATDSATSVATTSATDNDSSGETSATSTGGATGTGGTAGTGMDACQPLPQEGFSCMDDSDCEIAGDCCSCVAYNPNMGGPGNCGGGCGQTVCEQLGVMDAVCEAGVCRVRGLSCDQTAVTCDLEPPECVAGELPQVSDGCYTDACLPVEFCDWVPDCSVCPADEHCVITQTAGCDQHSCVPAIGECPPGPPTCDCLGNIVCSAPYNACAIDGDDIVCS